MGCHCELTSQFLFPTFPSKVFWKHRPWSASVAEGAAVEGVGAPGKGTAATSTEASLVLASSSFSSSKKRTQRLDTFPVERNGIPLGSLKICNFHPSFNWTFLFPQCSQMHFPDFSILNARFLLISSSTSCITCWRHLPAPGLPRASYSLTKSFLIAFLLPWQWPMSDLVETGARNTWLLLERYRNLNVASDIILKFDSDYLEIFRVLLALII